MTAGIRKVMAAIGRAVRIDIQDLLVFGGVALIGRGTWEIEHWLSYIVVGTLLLGLGLLPTWLRVRKDGYHWERREKRQG